MCVSPSEAVFVTDLLLPGKPRQVDPIVFSNLQNGKTQKRTKLGGGSRAMRKLLNYFRLAHYYRPIFLIVFLKEVFLGSVILFQSDSCFMRKDLGLRPRSFEFRRCG
jgi:hypothetical protein